MFKNDLNKSISSDDQGAPGLKLDLVKGAIAEGDGEAAAEEMAIAQSAHSLTSQEQAYFNAAAENNMQALERLQADKQAASHGA